MATTRLGATGHWPPAKTLTALAVSHDGTLLATSGDETLKFFAIQPAPSAAPSRERLSFTLDQPANWIRFARDAAGADRALLHCSPDGALQLWEAERCTAAVRPAEIFCKVSGKDRPGIPCLSG